MHVCEWICISRLSVAKKLHAFVFSLAVMSFSIEREMGSLFGKTKIFLDVVGEHYLLLKVNTV